MRLLKERSLKKLTLYVVRVNSQGSLMMSRPCENCMQVITDSGIREIIYSNELGGFSVEYLCG